MHKTIKAVAVVTAGTVAVGSITKSIKDVIVKRNNQAKIEREYNLDVQAINRASKIVGDRLDGGAYEYPYQLIDDFNALYEFEKIAIREEI